MGGLATTRHCLYTIHLVFSMQGVGLTVEMACMSRRWMGATTNKRRGVCWGIDQVELVQMAMLGGDGRGEKRRTGRQHDITQGLEEEQQAPPSILDRPGAGSQLSLRDHAGLPGDAWSSSISSARRWSSGNAVCDLLVREDLSETGAGGGGRPGAARRSPRS